MARKTEIDTVKKEVEYKDIECPHCGTIMGLKLIRDGNIEAAFYCPNKHLTANYEMRYLTSYRFCTVFLEDPEYVESIEESIKNKYKVLFVNKGTFKLWKWLNRKVLGYSRDKARSKCLESNTTLDKIPKDTFFKCPSASGHVFYFDGNTIQEFEGYTLTGWTLRPPSVAFDRLDPTKLRCTPPERTDNFPYCKFWGSFEFRLFGKVINKGLDSLCVRGLPRTVEEI